MKSIRVVLDTNVLHAGLYSASGASHRVLRLIEAGRVKPILSTTLLFEYEDVLLRHRIMLGLSPQGVEDVLDGLCLHGESRAVHFLWRPQLPDAKDDHVLELAVAATNVAIVTHNLRDFGPAKQFRIRVITPGDLLRDMR